MKKRLKFIMPAVLLFVARASLIAEAATGDTEWYENNAYLLSTSDIASSVFRWAGWGVTLGLCRLSESVGKLYEYTFNLIDITKFPEVDKIITMLRPVLIALIVVSVAYMGISMIIDRQKKPPIIRNIVLAALAVSCSLYAFNLLNSMAVGFKEGMLGKDVSWETYKYVDENIYDLVRMNKDIDKVNYAEGKNVINGAGINDWNKMLLISINETLNFDDESEGMRKYGWSGSFNELISKKITFGPMGATDLVDVNSGIFIGNIGNEFYYRYKFNYFVCYMELIAYLIMLIALSYKNVRIMYELIVARILAYLHGADITNGERLKQILLFIRDTYIVLGISVLSVRLFEVLTSYVSGHTSSGIIRGIVTLFIAFCVIDGPNIAERLLGMDAGLSRSWARTWGAMAVAGHLARRVLPGNNRGGSGKDSGDDGSGEGSSAVKDVKASDTNKSKSGDAVDDMNKAMKDKPEAGADGGGSDGPAVPEEPPISGSSPDMTVQNADNAADAKAALEAREPGAEAAASADQTRSAGSPDFMNNAGGSGEAGSASGAQQPQSQSNMHVDFMEKGSGQAKPATQTIPERPTTTNSSFTYRMPGEGVPASGGVSMPGVPAAVSGSRASQTAPVGLQGAGTAPAYGSETVALEKAAVIEREEIIARREADKAMSFDANKPKTDPAGNPQGGKPNNNDK